MDSAVEQVTTRLQQLSQPGGDSNEAAITTLTSAVATLRSCCSQATWSSSAAHAEGAWSHACALWNAAVDASNRGLASTTFATTTTTTTAIAISSSSSCAPSAAALQIAWLRHIACELLHAVPAGQLQEFQMLQLITFCLKSSAAWSDLGMWEQSDVVLAFACKAAAATCTPALQQAQQQPQPGVAATAAASKAEQLCVLLFDVQVARHLTAVKLRQQVVASQALAAARTAAEDLAPSPVTSSRLCVQLAGALHSSVTDAMLAATTEAPAEGESQHNVQAFIEPLSTAYELLTKVKAQQQQHNKAIASAPAVTSAASSAEALQQLLQLEAKVLLDMAFCHLRIGHDPTACLRCVDALRQLETAEGLSHPAVGLMALQAFLAAGNTQQAEVEAAGIAVNDAADVATCTAVLLELLGSPVAASMTDALKSVLELVLGRFPSEPTILPTFAQHALAAAAAAAATTAPATSASASYAQQLEQLVLQALEGHEAACAAVRADQGLAGQLHAVLYNHGVLRFERKCFEAAAGLFTAALDFAEDTVKAGVARVLVTCHLLLRQHTQAANYCKLAESYQPFVVATSFLRFKLLLLQGDAAEGVLSEVSHMVKCADFTPSMLHLACQEALSVSAVPVARAALKQLLALLQQQPAAGAADDNTASGAADAANNSNINSGSKAEQQQQQQLSEGWVLRALIKLDADELERQMKLLHTHNKEAAEAAAVAAEAEAAAAEAEAAAAEKQAVAAEEAAAEAAAASGCSYGGSSGGRRKDTAAAQGVEAADGKGKDSKSSSSTAATAATAASLAATAAATAATAARCAVQLSEVLNAAVARLKKLGADGLAGEGEGECSRLVEWMSSVAWNAALHSSGLCDYQPVAVLMHASAELLGQLPAAAVGPKHLRQQRVAYMMAAAAALEVHIALPSHTASLKLARKMCASVKGVSNKLLSGTAGATGSDAATGGTSEAFLLQLQFRIALQLQNTREQLDLVQQMSEHAAVSPDLLHKLADSAHRHAHRCPEVVSAALEGVWRKLMAAGSPEWPKVAEVMRRLLQQAGSDADKLRLYRECSSILTMLPRGTFPDRELSWLVSTAWNTALHHARFDRHAEAGDYMSLAVSLLPRCTPGCGLGSAQQEMMHRAWDKAQQEQQGQQGQGQAGSAVQEQAADV